jgi:hypothetical protein
MPELSTEFWIGAIITGIVSLVGLAVTLAMDARTKGEFRFAVGCFLLSAGAIIYGIEKWQMLVAWPARSRIVVAYFLFALVFVLTGEAIRWTHGRHLRASVGENSAPKPTLTSSAGLSGNSSGDKSAPTTEVSSTKPSAGLESNPPPMPITPSIKPRPELSMFFVNPRYPEWRIENKSAVVVEHALYWFALIDLDQPDLNSTPNLAGTVTPYAPLRIPVQQADFINPGDVAGALVFPVDLIQKIKVGDRIFGAAQLECPGCKDRGYWLYMKYGYDGWFSEMRGHTARGVEIKPPVQNTDEELEKIVPSAMRMQILPETRSPDKKGLPPKAAGE